MKKKETYCEVVGMDCAELVLAKEKIKELEQKHEVDIHKIFGQFEDCDPRDGKKFEKMIKE